MRFFPAMVELRRQIEEGLLGEVKHIHVAFGFRAEKVPDRLAQPELGGGAVLDLGVYCINLATMVFGEKPQRIQATGTLLDTGVDETVNMLLRCVCVCVCVCDSICCVSDLLVRKANVVQYCIFTYRLIFC